MIHNTAIVGGNESKLYTVTLVPRDYFGNNVAADDCYLYYYDTSGKELHVTKEMINSHYSFEVAPGIIFFRDLHYNGGGVMVMSGDAEQIYRSNDTNSRRIVIAVSGDCELAPYEI